MEGKSGAFAHHPTVGSVAVGGVNIPVKQVVHDISPVIPNKTKDDHIKPVLDDPQLDKAVDDIVVAESNEVLAAEDATTNILTEPEAVAKKGVSLKKIVRSKWLYIGLGAVIIAIFVIPFTRYPILATFIKNNYPLTVIDSVTDSPVSGAVISVDNHKVTTNSAGQATFKLPVGKHSFSIDRQFYANDTSSLFVGLSKDRGQTVHLIATGRQVPITITNKLTGKPLAGVSISVLNTSTYTNANGQTQIVLPTKKSQYEANISANGYNSLMIPIKVTTSKDINNISLTPSGSLFYLSDSTGTINVIKSSLDAATQTIELAGTGKESTATTALMASPDWKYLALEANRGTQPELYLINTATGNLTEFDSAADSFTLIGWSGDDFLYDEIASSEPTSTVGREQIKSYNATTGQLNIIDENQVVTNSPAYAFQSFSNFELLPNLLLYTTSWTSVNSYDLSSQNDTIRGVEPNGLNKDDYSSFPSSTTGPLKAVLGGPNVVYFSVVNSTNNQPSYYQFTNGAVSTTTATSFSATYPTFYLSPSDANLLWNSKGAVYIGNQDGQSGKRVTLPSGYNAIGWYDNVYILLSQGGSLYISPATGTSKPLLIGNFMSL